MNQDDLKQTIRLSADATKTESGGLGPPESGAHLIVVEGRLRGLVVDLVEDRTTIGRHADNDVVLDSGPVSKRHGVITKEGERFFLEDLGSTNGTILNSVRLPENERRRLSHGDNIRITDHLVIFRQHGCFTDSAGVSTIHVDRDRVSAEVDDLLARFGFEGGDNTN